jgi:hypothetical protein
MLSSKIRTTVIALVATSGFAAASMVPAVSQASKNTGAYGKSVEANTCHYFLGQFNEALAKLRQDQQSGASDAVIKQDREAANGMLGVGWEEGCAWASRVRSPESPTSGLVPPVGGITASPESAVPPVRGVQATSLAPAR